MNPTEEYKNMLDLLAIYSEASNRLTTLEADVNDELLTEMDARRDEYATLQKSQSDAKAALELLATKHPEWFGEKQSLKTLYGGLEFRKSTSLEIPNEEMTLALMDRDAESEKQLPQAQRKFDINIFTRTTRALNLEALGEMDDAFLERYKIKRVEKTNFAVKPTKVDMGKAVQQSAQRKAA